jgi:hypothetical protein
MQQERGIGMLLTADEVGRSLKGALRLLQREADGLLVLDTSVEGFWRSYAAILLTAPAFVAVLADKRVGLGLPAADLFGDSALVLCQAAAYLAAWIAFPVLMTGFARFMNLERAYPGYVVAYNWSNVIAAAMLALPAALHALGLATPAHALLYTAAFLLVLVHYRWFLARTALGVSNGLAALIVAIEIVSQFAILMAARAAFG